MKFSIKLDRDGLFLRKMSSNACLKGEDFHSMAYINNVTWTMLGVTVESLSLIHISTALAGYMLPLQRQVGGPEKG